MPGSKTKRSTRSTKKKKIQFVKAKSASASRKAKSASKSASKATTKSTTKSTRPATPRSTAKKNRKASTASTRNASVRPGTGRKSDRGSTRRKKNPTSSKKSTSTNSIKLQLPDLDSPGWEELIDAQNELTDTRSYEPKILGAISTVRLSLIILAIAGLFTLYVGHVQATQQLLDDVYQARKENLTLNLRYNVLQGRYETATGPNVIYNRASELGMREEKETMQPITISPIRK